MYTNSGKQGWPVAKSLSVVLRRYFTHASVPVAIPPDDSDCQAPCVLGGMWDGGCQRSVQSPWHRLEARNVRVKGVLFKSVMRILLFGIEHLSLIRFLA